MKKIVSLVMALLMITCCIPVSFAEADMTEYTSFNLWYTPNTHVKKGETISLLVKDGDGNVLNAENADSSSVSSGMTSAKTGLICNSMFISSLFNDSKVTSVISGRLLPIIVFIRLCPFCCFH